MSDGKDKNIFNRITHWLFVHIWDDEYRALGRFQKNCVAVTKFVLLVWRSFTFNHCMLHASALTFSTLVSIVPVLALTFSVSKGLGAGGRLKEVLETYLSQMPDKINEFAQGAFVYVEKTNFAALGIIGALMLFWSVISIMGNIEKSFNAIWNIPSGRSMYRKFTDYISVLVVVPLLMIAWVSITAMLSSGQMMQMVQVYGGPLFYLYKKLVGFAGLGSLTLAFSFLYMYVPNRKVKFVSALCGGVVSAVIWSLVQWAYIAFQVGVTKYNAIYGTFASVPIFLAWLYTSWIVILLGAEVSHVFEDFDLLRTRLFTRFDSAQAKASAAIWVCVQVASRFAEGQGPWDMEQARSSWMSSGNLLKNVIEKLEESNVIVHCTHPHPGYLLSKRAEQVTLFDVVSGVVDVMDNGKIPELGDKQLAKRICDDLEVAKNGFKSTLMQRSIADLIDLED